MTPELKARLEKVLNTGRRQLIEDAMASNPLRPLDPGSVSCGITLGFDAALPIIEKLVEELQFYAEGFTEVKAMDGNNYFEPKDALDGGKRARAVLAELKGER